MKKTGFSATAALLCSSSIFLCTLLDSTCALYCWENSCDGADNWRLQKCNTTNNEISCLAQYRLHNGAQKPSYFGCHTTDTPCGRSCDVEEGQRNDFSCCCSGDLCNEVAGMGSESDSLISIDTTSPSLCLAKQCSHSCVVQAGVAQCYCDWGHVLGDDGRTCVDLNECESNNGGCEGTCHNEVGTGYHCGCSSNQILEDDGLHCKAYAGQICYKQTCNATSCTPKVKQFCSISGTPGHCQATYKQDENGLKARFLSCFSGHFTCEQGGCTLQRISLADSPFYYCCCDGYLCNDNILLPDLS